MSLREARTVFMLGIGGTGMRGLAKLLHGQGKKIIGSDRQYDLIKNWEDMKNYEIFSEPANTPGESSSMTLAGESARPDVLIHTDAAERNHPLIKAAQAKGIPVLAYQEALGEFSQAFQTIAVTGTHGKSSTTSFLAHILIEAGKDPNVLIGAPVPAWGGGGGRAGKSNLFIVEADEYREHFLTLSPAHAIIVSVDFDHPDYFKSLHDVEQAYERFRTKVAGSIFTPEDVTVEDLADMPAPLPGDHMKKNAALAVKMAGILGVSRENAIAALKTFPGLGRRFEKLGMIGKMELYSDYGHHPKEIEATLKAARSKYQAARILALFEAHTLERLKTFFNDYAAALSLADGILLVPVFIPAGREHESAEAREKLQELQGTLKAPAWRLEKWEDLKPALVELSAEFDVALAFTAGVLDARLRKLS